MELGRVGSRVTFQRKAQGATLVGSGPTIGGSGRVTGPNKRPGCR